MVVIYQNYDKILAEIVKNINVYRKISLSLPTNKSMPMIVLLIKQIREIYALLTKHQQKKLGKMLGQMMAAMENKDYVLVRDVLVYDICDFFVSIM